MSTLLYTCAASIVDNLLPADLYAKLLLQYYDLANAFSKHDAKILPPYRPRVDIEIHLKLGPNRTILDPLYLKLYPKS